MSKKDQQRPATRAPHGAPEFSERIAFYYTAKQKKVFMKRGHGYAWMRKLIDEELNRGRG